MPRIFISINFNCCGSPFFLFIWYFNPSLAYLYTRIEHCKNKIISYFSNLSIIYYLISDCISAFILICLIDVNIIPRHESMFCNTIDYKL